MLTVKIEMSVIKNINSVEIEVQNLEMRYRRMKLKCNSMVTSNIILDGSASSMFTVVWRF